MMKTGTGELLACSDIVLSFVGTKALYKFATTDPTGRESRIPDFRNTLCWDPQLRTESNGRAIAEFFTSDKPGDYLILVEGFTFDGIFGSGTGHLVIKSDGNDTRLLR